MKHLLLNGYVIAVLATLSLLVVLKILQPIFGGAPPAFLFLVGVMFAAWYGGFRAGFLATVLSTLASTYLLAQPSHSWQITQESEQVRLLLFAGVGSVLSLVIARLRQAEERALQEALQQKEHLEQEITTRQQAERALIAAHREAVTARNRLEAVLESLPVGVAIVDVQGGSIRSNRAFEQVWRGPRPVTQSVSDYAAYQAWWVDTGRSVQPEEWASAQAVQQGKTVVGQWLEIARFDGTRGFVHNSAAPIRDESGGIVGSAVALMDVTAQLKNEAALRESEERYRLAIEAAQLGTWDWDLASNQIVWNPGHAEIFGYPPQEGPWDYQAYAARVHPEDLPQVEAALAEAKQRHTRYACDYRLLWPDGTLRWVSALGDFHYGQQGHPVRMSGVVMDITERKQAEEALREADRRKNEFLAMLGHELRNPLAPIRNAVQIMRKLEVEDSKLQWARELVDRQVGHLTRLVEDLLDVSRIAQGKLTLKKAPLDLHTVIDLALETSQPLIEARRHEFKVSLPEEPLFLKGDRLRLAQVVSNLLNNAAKYTPEGGRIWLTITHEDGDAVLSVRDTGEGIAGTLLPYLFDVFTQGERTLDRAQGGLGLGLTIVQNIVARHGGRVEARSEGHGQGSEFVVRLPVLERELPSAVSFAAG